MYLEMIGAKKVVHTKCYGTVSPKSIPRIDHTELTLVLAGGAVCCA